MRRIRMVRKRDGRLVPFEERKIADAIYKAALAVGGADRFLAEELAEVVTVFLEKSPDVTIPTIEQIQDMVEKVLIETGHARTAKAYILYREERRKVRRVRQTRETPPPAPEPAGEGPGVLDLSRGRVAPWSEDVLVAALEAAADLPREAAREIAREVAAEIRSAGVERVSTSVVASLADATLFRKGLLTDRAGLAGAPRERIRDLLRPRDGRAVEDPAGGAGRLLLREFALGTVHSPAVTAAHVEGRIHVHGLETPSGLIGASVHPDLIKRPGRGSGAGPAAEAAALGRRLARLARSVEGRFAADDVNVALAPLVRGLSPERVREVAAVFLHALDGRVEVNLDTEVPALLAILSARDAEGAELPVCYGELAREARELLAAFLDLWKEGEDAGAPLLALHVGPRGLSDPALLGSACGAALRGRPVTFVRMSDGRALRGCSVYRHPDPGGEILGTLALGKVTLHLPSAAARANGGCPTRFLAECAELMDLALRALRERQSFLRRVAATPGAPLAALVSTEGRGVLDLERAVGIVGLAGLNEAVEACLGRELHEEDEALKLGERAAAFFRLQAEEERREGDPPIVVSECWERDVLERLRNGSATLTAGARMRWGAPIDLVTRIEREGRFHPVVGSATVSALFPLGEPVPAASAVALVRKTFENTPAAGLRLGREAG